MLEEQRRTIILEIQQVAEKILKAHKIITRPGDLLKGEWFLKLQKPGFEKTGACQVWRRDFRRVLHLSR